MLFRSTQLCFILQCLYTRLLVPFRVLDLLTDHLCSLLSQFPAYLNLPLCRTRICKMYFPEEEFGSQMRLCMRLEFRDRLHRATCTSWLASEFVSQTSPSSPAYLFPFPPLFFCCCCCFFRFALFITSSNSLLPLCFGLALKIKLHLFFVSIFNPQRVLSCLSTFLLFLS